MKKYITQLLADIRAAHRPKATNLPSSPTTFEEAMEKWAAVAQPSLKPFSEHCGLSVEQFPMPDRLDGQQVHDLCETFEKLLSSWNYSTDMPSDLPIVRKYLLYISLLNKPIPIVSFGEPLNLIFCTDQPTQCPFGPHCTCKSLPKSPELAAFEKERLEKKKAAKEKRLQQQAEAEKKRAELLAQMNPAEVAKIEKEIEAMDRYVTYLLKDLKAATENLPNSTPNLGKTLPIEDMEWIEELANTPYKTIEEWTGIAFEALPDEARLTGDQIERLVEGLDELWDAWYWLFDMEDYMENPVIRYRMYWDCWTDYVQYLPNSGFEVELCNGAVEGCRMGEDCICIENPLDLSWDEPPFMHLEDGEETDLPF